MLRISFSNIFLGKNVIINWFCPGDLRIYQQLEIAHSIFFSFDFNPLYKLVVFFDKFEVFDKVLWRIFLFKNYLHCKLITSENVICKTQFEIFYFAWKGDVPFLRYSGFYILNMSNNFEKFYIMMRISTWGRRYVQDILWIVNYQLVMKLGKLI